MKFWIPGIILGVLALAIAATLLMEPPATGGSTNDKKKTRTKPSISIGSQSESEVAPLTAPANPSEAYRVALPDPLDLAGLPNAGEGLPETTWTVQEGNALAAETDVLGLLVGDLPVAIPRPALRPGNQVINLKVGPLAIAVAIDESQETCLAFLCKDGDRFRMLRERWRDTLLLQDDATRSLWSPVLGRAIQGSRAGHQLTLLPVALCPAKRWLELYPGTQVAAPSVPEEAPSANHTANPTQENAAATAGDAVVVVVQGTQRFHVPFPDSQGRQVVALNDGQWALIFQQSSASPHTFRQQLDGKAMRLQWSGSVLVDRETESTWDPATGRATSGPLAGKTLERVPTYRMSASAWQRLLNVTPSEPK